MSVEQSQTKVQQAQQIKRLLQNCIGFSGDELQTYRQQAYDYYFQRPRGDEMAGRSSIVTGDLSSMIEGNLAQMIEPLTNKRIAEFCSYDAGDEEQAQLESDCVTEMLFKRQNGFISLVEAIKDAMLMRNGVTKIYVDHRTFKQRVRRTNVDPVALDDLLSQIGNVEVHSLDTETGEFSATVTKETHTFSVETVAPENFLYLKTWHKVDLKGIPFCAERHVDTRATMIERGFDKKIVNDLPAWNNRNQSATDARMPRSVSFGKEMPFDKSQEQIEWYECYVLQDDGDGTSELRNISVAGGGTMYVLDDEPADFICYAAGLVLINPHTFMGISMHDKLKSTQDSTTALTRGLMDNMNGVNKNRTVHMEGVVDDSALGDGRINGSIGVKQGYVPDVRMALTALAIPDTTGTILQNLQHMRTVRSEMGGAALDMATGQMQLNERVGSMGLDRAYSVMESQSALMTRLFAHTLIRSMYLIAHETLRTQWPEKISFKRGKDWLVTEPAKWRVREALTINLGASVGERARVSAVYEKVIDKQIALAQLGMEGVLVDAAGFYTAVTQWMRTNDIDVPERFWIDPRTPAAQKELQSKAIQRQQDKQKQDALMYQAVALEQLRVAFDKYRTDAELQFKYYDAVLDAQIEEAKLTVPAVVDLRKAHMDAKTAREAGNRNVGNRSNGTPEERDTRIDDERGSKTGT